MIITTKYDIGHIFYCARSYPETKKVTAMIDGKEWVRNDTTYKAVIKKKIITAITIDCMRDHKTKITYLAKYYPGTKNELATYYNEEQIDGEFNNYEDALQAAQSYAALNIEYHGRLRNG